MQLFNPGCNSCGKRRCGCTTWPETLILSDPVGLIPLHWEEANTFWRGFAVRSSFPALTDVPGVTPPRLGVDFTNPHDIDVEYVLTCTGALFFWCKMSPLPINQSSCLYPVDRNSALGVRQARTYAPTTPFSCDALVLTYNVPEWNVSCSQVNPGTRFPGGPGIRSITR